MKRLRSRLLVLPVLLVLCAGWSCGDKYKKAGQFSRDFAAGVSAFQDAEIILHQQGKISDAEHADIQKRLLQVAASGKRMNADIQAGHNAKSTQGEVDATANAVQDLLDSGVTQIKNQEAQLALKSATLSLKIILDSILALAGK